MHHSLSSLFPHLELPVEFLNKLPNLEIIEKQTATFECEISKPNQKAKWFQNADEIIANTPEWERFTTEVDGTIHRLVISNAHLDDSTKYRCVISDKQTTGSLKVKGQF